ncbi:MAG: RDD family protein [Actinobacteria bacterium]|nr:RDD family protein [Actinomycetota bacterium]MBV8598173.1 RDD family protein [Actinomycetota bacterium]
METAEGAYGGPRAGFWRRFAAALIDAIIVGIASGILEAILHGVGYLLAVVVGLTYYGWLEGSASGQTVGKRGMGIRVYDIRGRGPIGFGRGVGRYFARILSAIPLFLGYFWMLWDAESQTWHDKLVGTVVVPVDAYPLSGGWPN